MDSKQLIRRLALCGVSMAALLCNSDAFSNPQGGNVVAGDATITSSGKKLDVHQKSNSAIIDWNRFDIDVDEHTQFHQPSANATALNRVKGHDPSNILGKLTANGNIILINPNGVFFGRDSVVDVNGLIATTADINNDDFMAGKLEFNTSGNPDAAIINEGLITAKEAGLVGLVAPNVLNSGIITAKLGKVQLASGDTFAIDLYGDGLYSIAVSDDVVSQLVVNTGKIEAEGGKIAITAAAAKEIVNSLIVIEGELKAPTIEEKNGKIIISASGSNAVESNVANEKGQKEGSSNIVISNALIDTSGYDEGEQGGEIEVLADNINILENTVIDASGYEAKESTQRADGGTATLTEDKDVRSEKEFLAHENRAGGSIKIGGDYLGKGDTASAEYVYVDPFSLILNDAIKSGDGGRTIIWSDNTTEFYGNVYARGGLEGGNGGFLETSGKINLKAQGYADLTSEYGYKKGTYLLDPANITIYGNVDPTFVSTDTSIDLASDLQLWLDGNDIDADNDVNDNPVNGTSISTWYDKSGKSNDAFTVSATKPVFDNSSIYGKGSVQFNGNSHFDTNLSINSSVMPNITVFSVYTLNAINGGAPFGEDNSSWDRFILDGIDTLDEIVSIGTGKINNYDLFNGTNTTITSVVWKEDIANGSYVNVNGINNNGTFTSNTGPESSNTLEIGALGKNDFLFNGLISETIIYNVELSNNSRHLIDQYQSAKWNIDLTPPGTGGTESAKAMASDGYSIFAVDYLEKLSSTADIVLQADNTISLDLQGDSLDLTDDRSITMQTTNGDISTASIGTINTNRTTTGGNITFTAGGTGNIVIDHDLTLNAKGGGDVTLNAGEDVILNAKINRTAGSDSTLNINADDSIFINDDITSTSNKLDITFSSDADNSGAGGIAITNATINSNGGDITLGGGYDPDGTGTKYSAEFAKGTSSNDDGIYVRGLLNSGVGNITLRGEGYNDTDDKNFGIHVHGNVFETTSGNVDLFGIGGSGTHSNAGVYFSFFNDTSVTDSGDITITAIAGSGSSSKNNPIIYDSHHNNFQIGSNSGDLTLNLVEGASSTRSLGKPANGAGHIPGGGLSLGTGDINIYSDNFSVDSLLIGFQTAGNVRFAPYTASNSISAGYASGSSDTNFDTDILNYVHSDVSKVIIGRSDGTGDIDIAARDWGGDSLDILSNTGNVTLVGNQTNLNDFNITTGGDLDVNGAVSGVGELLFDITDDITLNDDISTTSSATNALTLSSDSNFINNAGSNAVSAANSRWLVYSNDPVNNTRGGLLPDASDFGKTYASDTLNTIGSGNRLVYATSTRPTLNYQIGDETITYGETVSGSSAYVSGLLSGDTLSNISQTGAASYSTDYSSTGTATISATQGAFFNALGYDYNFFDGQATVEKATLNVSLGSTNYTRLKYASDPVYGLKFSGFKLGDDVSGIDASPVALSDATFSSTVGLYDIFLSDGLDDNYEFSFSSPVGALEVKPIELPKSVENISSSVKDTVLSKVKSKIDSKIKEQNNREFDLDLDYKKYNKDEGSKYKAIKIIGGLVELSPEVAKMLGIKEDSLFYQKIK